MIYTEGQTARLTETFLDEHGDVLDYSDNHPPIVTIMREGEVLSEVYATADSSAEPGTWVAEVTIPNLSLHENIRLTALWTFIDLEGGSHRTRQYLDIEPDNDQRVGDITFIANLDNFATVVVPFVFQPGVPAIPADTVNRIPARPAVPGDEISVSLFTNNNAMMYQAPLVYGSDGLTVKIGSSTTTLKFPVMWSRAFFEPMMLVVTHEKNERQPITYTYNVWPSNSSILSAAKQLEDFINKAHLKNVIPELDYTQGDLLMYLNRGLSLFNALEQITAFTGVNMTGYMQEAWLICAAYYALAAQLQAEGALAFDFSGQTVSLNIDRTPSIESALGRIENQIENVVRPLKKRLVQAGVTGGDGSNGTQPLNGARSKGVLGLTNAPTTRLPYTGRNGSWFRPMF